MVRKYERPAALVTSLGGDVNLRKRRSHFPGVLTPLPLLSSTKPSLLLTTLARSLLCSQPVVSEINSAACVIFKHKNRSSPPSSRRTPFLTAAMAPPPPNNLPLMERLQRLATTLQFVSCFNSNI